MHLILKRRGSRPSWPRAPAVLKPELSLCITMYPNYVCSVNVLNTHRRVFESSEQAPVRSRLLPRSLNPRLSRTIWSRQQTATLVGKWPSLHGLPSTASCLHTRFPIAFSIELHAKRKHGVSRFWQWISVSVPGAETLAGRRAPRGRACCWRFQRRRRINSDRVGLGPAVLDSSPQSWEKRAAIHYTHMSVLSVSLQVPQHKYWDVTGCAHRLRRTGRALRSKRARVACDWQRVGVVITCDRGSAWRRTEGGGRAVRAARTWRPIAGRDGRREMALRGASAGRRCRSRAPRPAPRLSQPSRKYTENSRLCTRTNTCPYVKSS